MPIVISVCNAHTAPLFSKSKMTKRLAEAATGAIL